MTGRKMMQPITFFKNFVIHTITLMFLMPLYASEEQPLEARPQGPTNPEVQFHQKISFAIPLKEKTVKKDDGSDEVECTYTLIRTPDGLLVPKRNLVSLSLYDATQVNFRNYRACEAPLAVNEKCHFSRHIGLVVKMPRLFATKEYAIELMQTMLMEKVSPEAPTAKIQDFYLNQLGPDFASQFFPETMAEKLLPVHVFLPEGLELPTASPWLMLVAGTSGMRLSELKQACAHVSQNHPVAIVDYANIVHQDIDACSEKHATLEDQLTKQSFISNGFALHCAISKLSHLFGNHNYGIVAYSLGSVITQIAFDNVVIDKLQSAQKPCFIHLYDPMTILSSGFSDLFLETPVSWFFSKYDSMFKDQYQVCNRLIEEQCHKKPEHWAVSLVNLQHDGYADADDYARYPERTPLHTPYLSLCHVLQYPEVTQPSPSESRVAPKYVGPEVLDLITRHEMGKLGADAGPGEKANIVMEIMTQRIVCKRLNLGDTLSVTELLSTVAGLKRVKVNVGRTLPDSDLFRTNLIAQVNSKMEAATQQVVRKSTTSFDLKTLYYPEDFYEAAAKTPCSSLSEGAPEELSQPAQEHQEAGKETADDNTSDNSAQSEKTPAPEQANSEST